MDQDKEGEKVERSLVHYCLSGETNGEKNRRVEDQQPGQGSLSEESDVDEKFPDEKQDLENKVLSGEFGGCEEGTELIWRRGPALSQALQWRTTPGFQGSAPTQTGTRAQDPNCQS